MKDINESIINTILNEGKWSVANVPVNNESDSRYIALYESLSEELTQELNRLDESIQDEDIVEGLLQEYEALADKDELTEEESVYADVLEDKLQEGLFGYLKDKGLNALDRIKAYHAGGTGKRLQAARHIGNIERRETARKLRGAMDRESMGARARLTNRLRKESGLSARQYADKRKQLKGSGQASDDAAVMASGPRARRIASQKRAAKRRSFVDSPTTTSFRPGQTDLQRREAFNKRNRGHFQKGDANVSRVRSAARQAQGKAAPVAKKAKPPVAKKGKVKRTDTSYQHDHEEHGTISIAESIINNVRNRLL
jgi:hypothetical protein